MCANVIPPRVFQSNRGGFRTTGGTFGGSVGVAETSVTVTSPKTIDNHNIALILGPRERGSWPRLELQSHPHSLPCCDIIDDSVSANKYYVNTTIYYINTQKVQVFFYWFITLQLGFLVLSKFKMGWGSGVAFGLLIPTVALAEGPAWQMVSPQTGNHEPDHPSVR